MRRIRSDCASNGSSNTTSTNSAGVASAVALEVVVNDNSNNSKEPTEILVENPRTR